MKNNTFFKLFIILILAFLFRVWFLDKPEGLWNDEYTSWYIASENNLTHFIANVFRNCHAPLYYLYLKIWMFFFGNSDFLLRVSSVIPSVLTVIVLFFAGKEVKDTKLGLFIALLAAINSFYIYFAQEVRLYSLLGLFSSITALYFIKLTKNQSKINFIIYFLSNILICLLHTLGIIFLFFNILFLLTYLYKYNEKYKELFKHLAEIIKYIMPFIVVAIVLTPFLATVVFSHSLSQFWSNFSFSKVLYIFMDYFSPIQTNIVNSKDNIYYYIVSRGKINFQYIIFSIIPSIIALFAIIKAYRENNKNLNYLLYSALSFFSVLVLISLTGKMILLTKYSSEIFPVLLIYMAIGLMSFKTKHLKSVISIIYIGLCLFYLYYAADSAPKKTRTEGHLAVIKLLENSNLKPDDIVILTYYDEQKFGKYITERDKYKFNSITKNNFHEIIFNNPDYYQTIKQGKTLYKEDFRKFPNNIIVNYIRSNYALQLKKGDRIGVIFLDSVSFISNKKIQVIINNDKEYKNTPFIFLVFSTLKNNILYSFKDDFRIDTITQSGNWTLFVFEKIR